MTIFIRVLLIFHDILKSLVKNSHRVNLRKNHSVQFSAKLVKECNKLKKLKVNGIYCFNKKYTEKINQPETYFYKNKQKHITIYITLHITSEK